MSFTPEHSATRGISPTLILLAFVAFISLGLPDTLLGIAWPSMRETFHRLISEVGWILAVGMAGYLTSSFLGGSIMRRVGVGALLAGSCSLVTLALTLYAISPVWPVVFVAALVGGLGAGAIDAGINAFGAQAFSPRVMNWLHGCWGIGATLGPLIMTAFIANQLGWRAGYGTIAVVMVILTTLFFATIRLWKIGDRFKDQSRAEPNTTSGTLEAMRQPAVQGQTLFYFLYGGVEFGAGTWLYILLHESRGLDAARAGMLVSAYWASLTVGRMVFGQLASKIRPLAILRIGLVGALLSIVLLFNWFPVEINGLGVFMLGFSLAPLYPTTMTLTPTRVGERFAHHAVGFQVSAAALGISVLPGLIGFLARRQSIEVLPFMLLGFAVPLFLLNELITATARRPSRRKNPAHSDI